MAGKTWKLTPAMVEKILALGKENPGSVKPVFQAFKGAREDVVRSVLSANGLTTSKPEIVEKDKAKVTRLTGLDVTHHPREKSAPPTEEDPVREDSVLKVPESAPDEAIEIPEAVRDAVTANAAEAEKHRRAPRKRAPRKDGQPSEPDTSVVVEPTLEPKTPKVKAAPKRRAKAATK